MKLGAQFYSIRHETDTPEKLHASFAKIADIGYEITQMSGICQMEAEALRDISKEFSLPITCTHSAFDRIINDTDALIREHKIYGADTIGIGSLPEGLRSAEGAQKFLEDIAEPMRKIKDAGLYLAYHNHAFEFEIKVDGKMMYDLFIEECTDLHFIMDTYWVAYAGYDPIAYIEKIGGARMKNIHYKDLLAKDRSICACGDGTLDFSAITAACVKAGVPNALVEQDNAPDFPDAFEQLARSYRYLAPIIEKTR